MTTDFEEELNKIRQKCFNCNKCGLCKTRTNTVFSAGIPNSKLMLIGEAPGYYEDMKGEPFVGKAGQLLDKILGCVGFSRKENIYICNTIKCRPPGNRDPLPEEKIACKEYLDAQIDILKPRIILLCGRVAVKSFLNTNHKAVAESDICLLSDQPTREVFTEQITNPFYPNSHQGYSNSHQSYSISHQGMHSGGIRTLVRPAFVYIKAGRKLSGRSAVAKQ